MLISSLAEMPELAEHGVTLPPNMQGLTEDQVLELKLKDEWEEKCIPSGGAVFSKDEIGRRNGHGQPQTCHPPPNPHCPLNVNSAAQLLEIICVVLLEKMTFHATNLPVGTLMHNIYSTLLLFCSTKRQDERSAEENDGRGKGISLQSKSDNK